MEEDHRGTRKSEPADTGLIRIAVTGPESSGKSTLSEALARHFETVWVKEYAREYIDGLQRPYREEDLLTIARGQLLAEQKQARQARNNLLFSDTELTVIKIWSEVKYKRCDPRILELLQNTPYNLYLLTAPDLPWQDDPQREHPHFREELFELYQRELQNRKLPFIIIRGEGPERLGRAIEAVKGLLL